MFSFLKIPRSLRASWRDTLLLIKEFQRPLILFLFAIAGMGIVYYYLSHLFGEGVRNVPEAIYIILTATFLQPSSAFPIAPGLQVFHFIMPILGVGILAQGLADFGVLLFNRRARGKEWEMAVASTFQNHIVLVGVGHLGFRVATQLHEMEQEVVAIELNPSAELVANTRKLDIPVIQGDGTKEDMLEAAGIRRAKAIILCTQNDSLNLQMSVKARGMNPNIQVVIRIFDDDFAGALQSQFNYLAISATGIAAPVFAASAAGANITPPIMVEGNPLCFGTVRMTNPVFSGIGLHELERRYHITVVFHRRDGRIEWHPSGEETIQENDAIGILGNPEKINQIVHACK